MIITSSELLP